jgi:hypothetical protein
MLHRRPVVAPVTSLLIVSLASSGCVSIPITGAPSTNEPLSVQTVSNTYSVNEKVKVGSMTHRDRLGRVTGTTDMTQNRTRRVTEYDWRLYQGDAPVDESDFYHIAGDVERSDLVDTRRKGAASLQTAGWVTFALGIVATLGSAAFIYSPLNQMPGGERFLDPSLGFIVVGLFGAVAGLGYFLSSLGGNQLKPNAHILTEQEAITAAEAYNRTLP